MAPGLLILYAAASSGPYANLTILYLLLNLAQNLWGGILIPENLIKSIFLSYVFYAFLQISRDVARMVLNSPKRN